MDRTAMRMKMRELLPEFPGDGLDYVLTELLKAGGVEAEAQALRDRLEAADSWATIASEQLKERDKLREEVARLNSEAVYAAAGFQAAQEEVAALRARVVVSTCTYATQPGESVMGIAMRQLKDEDRWPEIRDLNAGRFPDMGPHDYYPPGTELVMPARLNGKAVSEGLLRRMLRDWESNDTVALWGDMEELQELLGEGKEAGDV